MPLADIRRLHQQPRHAHELLEAHKTRLEERFAEAERRLAAYERLMRRESLLMRVERPKDLVGVSVEWVRVNTSTGQHAVGLRTLDNERVLPIWIGLPEATAISLAVEGQVPERPLTVDLAVSLCEAAKATINGISVWRSESEPTIFFAAVELLIGDRRELVDARPSDAIALALRVGAPILVSRATLDAAAVRVDGGEPQLPERHAVAVVTDTGERLGEAQTFTEPAEGMRVHEYRAFDVTSAFGNRVEVRELAALRRLAVMPGPKKKSSSTAE